jgi:tetratricopeptide (TPR) repeat protein
LAAIWCSTTWAPAAWARCTPPGDRELQRKIALKLVRPERKEGEGASQARARFLREAQALAQISHPNVVAVFDLGPWGDEVYLAMEFVEGRELAAFLDELPPATDKRRWPRVLEIFRQIGRGLEAVHAAGLVHRDVKPSNLMIGSDGRARVMDFGLARRVGERGEEAVEQRQSPLDARLTHTGLRLGTPSYMAPEQYLGLPCDTRCDIFSFCVAFYEALFGRRPFGEGPELAGRVIAGELEPRPAGSPVPEELHQVLARGLARDPADRWSSVGELMAACEAIPQRRRRRRLAAAAIAAAALFGLALFAARSYQENLCGDAEERLEAVFGAPQKKRIAAAFAAGGKDFEKQAGAGLLARLEAWGKSWAAQRREACEATHRTGVQSGDLLDRRMICLDRRLAELAATVRLVADPPDRTRSPSEALKLLGDLDACSDLVQLTETGPPPPAEQREKLREIQLLLVEASAASLRQGFAEGEALARRAVAAADQLGYPSLVADARLGLGELLVQTGRFEEGKELQLAAVAAATAGRDNEALARAAEFLARLHSEVLGKPKEAEPWARIAEAAAGQLGHRPLLASSQAHMRAMIATKSGDNEKALFEMRRALAAAEAADGSEDKQSSLQNDLGIVLGNLGRYDQAETALRKSLEIERKLYGEGHPATARALDALGGLYFSQERHEEALEHQQAALDLLIEAYGEEHRVVALSMNNVATGLRAVGRLDEADRLQLRAVEILEKVLGPDHIELAIGLANLAFNYRERGELGKALELYRRALPIYDKQLAPPNFYLAGAHHGTGVTLHRLRRYAEALPHLQHSFDAFHQTEVDPRFRGGASFQLAQTLWEEGGDRPRARRMAAKAIEDYRAEAGRFAQEIARVEAWLAERR